MFGYIYKTTDYDTGKIYIGQKRSSVFLGNKYFGSGVIIRRIVKHCIETGVDPCTRLHVELLEECYSQDMLNNREIYWIAKENSHSVLGYNLNDGGAGGNHNLGKKLPSRDLHGDKNPMYGKHHSVETKKKISAANSGKKFSDDINKKKGVKGKILSDDHKTKISESNTGKKRTSETSSKISSVRTGKIFITDGVITKSISPEELNMYDPQIWRRGRTFNSNPWNRGETAKTNSKLKAIGEKTKETRIKNGGYKRV